ncbi:traN-like protein [Serratia sp. S1B]|nr:traN-like protein [Serratia sp. S1B]
MKPVTPFKNPGSDRDTLLTPAHSVTADSDSINILEQVQQQHDEQQILIANEQSFQSDATGIEQKYNEAVDSAITDKEVQAENLENRLESQIDKQESVLQQMMSRQPGFLSLPGQKSKWQAQVQQQQALLSRLQSRLETVKELHDGMGLHGPRINELATAKVRHQEPELAERWDEMREAQRAHENLKRQQEKERKEKIRREQVPTLGKSNSLNLTRTID